MADPFHLSFSVNGEPADELVDPAKTLLCRCTGYLQILDAVEAAAKQMSSRRADGPTAEPSVGADLQVRTDRK